MKNAKTFALTCWFAFLFVLAAQSFMLTGCSSLKGVTSTETIKDSTWVKKTVKPFDTVVKVPGNKVEVSATLDELTEGQVIENTIKNLTASLRREGNTVIADCNQEELEVIIRLQNELIEMYRLKETKKDKLETITVPEPYVPWYIYPLLCIGVLAIIYVAYRIMKHYLIPKI